MLLFMPLAGTKLLLTAVCIYGMLFNVGIVGIPIGCIMGMVMPGLGLCAGLLGLDFSWFIDGAGPALGDLGPSKLSTSILIAPDVSAHVAPNLVVGLLLFVGGGRVVVGCSKFTGVG